MAEDKCPLQKKYGDTICIDGTLWSLTYSDCAPPDQRQAMGDCPHCRRYEQLTPPHWQVFERDQEIEAENKTGARKDEHTDDLSKGPAGDHAGRA